jgi:hypothetical protein
MQVPNTITDFKEPNCSPELLMHTQSDSVHWFFLSNEHSQSG